jgi:hypothetical protein
MFYAPFIAIHFFRPSVVSIAAFIAPYGYYLLWGNPPIEQIGILSLELFIFTQIVYLINSKFGTLSLNAPVSYLLTKIISLFVLMILPYSFINNSPLNFVAQSTLIALPGVIILFLISRYIRRYL